MSTLKELQESALSLIALLKLHLHLLVYCFQALVMFVQSVELVDQFLVIIERQKLFHLLDLLYLSLLCGYLLLHLLHNPLVTGYLLLHFRDGLRLSRFGLL